MRDADRPSSARNVLGGPLAPCCEDPATGFFRDGYCHTGPQDVDSHTICASVTPEFLEFSREHGNDLGTPRPEFMFPGLVSGDRWCLCAARWLEAAEAGAAPPVVLIATHEHALHVVPLELLMRHALDRK